MQNASYTIQKFSENFSEITTVKQLIELVKAQTFKLEIEFVHKIPQIFTWHPETDSFSGEYYLGIYPKIIIDGITFEPPKMFFMEGPSKMVSYEAAFIEALKEAISSILSLED